MHLQGGVYSGQLVRNDRRVIACIVMTLTGDRAAEKLRTADVVYLQTHGWLPSTACREPNTVHVADKRERNRLLQLLYELGIDGQLNVQILESSPGRPPALRLIRAGSALSGLERAAASATKLARNATAFAMQCAAEAFRGLKAVDCWVCHSPTAAARFVRFSLWAAGAVATSVVGTYLYEQYGRKLLPILVVALLLVGAGALGGKAGDFGGYQLRKWWQQLLLKFARRQRVRRAERRRSMPALCPA